MKKFLLRWTGANLERVQMQKYRMMISNSERDRMLFVGFESLPFHK